VSSVVDFAANFVLHAANARLTPKKTPLLCIEVDDRSRRLLAD
jgi:hypothetical protein